MKVSKTAKWNFNFLKTEGLIRYWRTTTPKSRWQNPKEVNKHSIYGCFCLLGICPSRRAQWENGWTQRGIKFKVLGLHKVESLLNRTQHTLGQDFKGYTFRVRMNRNKLAFLVHITKWPRELQPLNLGYMSPGLMVPKAPLKTHKFLP